MKYRCPVCKSANNHLIIDNGIDYEYGVTGNFKYYECDKCQLIFLYPRPPLPKIVNYYPSSYHSYQRPSSSVFKLLSKININKRKEKYEHLIGKSGKILDVGCGDGEIMEALEEDSNYECFGIEFKKEIVQQGKIKGLKIAYGTLETTKAYRDSTFNLLIMNHLVEHLQKPELTLNKAYQLLKPDGWISGETPNSQSIERILLNKKWAGYHIPRHLQIFSSRNIVKFLKNAGFSKIVIKKSYTPGQWALSLQNRYLSIFPKTNLKNGKSKLYPLFLLIAIPIMVSENIISRESSVMYFEAQK